jgi:pimeloyl-ACP methyl ester carboxylesterase
MKLYALLIGINEYHKDSLQSIPTLYACLNDVAAMKNILHAYFEDMIPDKSQIQVLQNEQASRKNVINGFANHLCQAQKDDVVLIYYAGHGSSGITAPEFREYTSDDQEQTWVLYDSRTEGGLDLADKEIALLLDKISQTQAHITVISDSCHSGSITRDIEDYLNLKPRFCASSKKERTLTSYLNGAYLQRYDLKIPNTDSYKELRVKHILFAACTRLEKAREGFDNHGIFTKALLNVLEQKNGLVQYSELSIRIQAEILRLVKNQTPQTEVFLNFNPNDGFLGRAVDNGLFKRFAIIPSSYGSWDIKLGAINGIQSNIEEPIGINVYDAYYGGSLLGETKIENIGLEKSKITGNNVLISTTKEYWGEPLVLPLSPVLIYCDSLVANLMQPVFAKALQSGILLHEDRTDCSFEVKVESNEIWVYDIIRNIKIQGVTGLSESSIQGVFQILSHLTRWHRTLELQNKYSNLNSADVDLKLILHPNQSNETIITDSTITIEHDGISDIPFKIVFNNQTKRALHICLLYLTNKYGIQVEQTETEILQPKSKELKIIEHNFTLNNNNNEEIDTIKFIVSSEPIDKLTFDLRELEIEKLYPITRGIDFNKTIQDNKPDWLTKAITVRVVRKREFTIGKKTIGNLGNGITIKDHNKFRASLNKSALIPQTRGIDNNPINTAYFTNNPYFEILNFADDSRLDNRLLELSNIQDADALLSNPLEIIVNPENAEEVIIPMFFDGQDLLPIGDLSINTEGQMIYSISHIPKDVGRVKTRSAVTATCVLFIKFINKIGFKGITEKLQWVDYNDKAIRKSIDLNKKIENANRILLLIHGIIGDTEEMAKPFSAAIDEKGYDLVLTYDYENLNTSIFENSRLLLETLQKYGFGETDNKELVIVAHSMGGLVSRYMIEHLGGHKFIDKLIMAGTPNGGSKFGAVPTYIDWLSNLLWVGTFFSPSSVLSIASSITKVSKAVALISLDEMASTSTFIKNLALGSLQNVPYTILGGNSDAYFNNNEYEKTWLEKAFGQISNKVYSDEKHDIAVSLDSIFAVDAVKKQELVCHHMNYFKVQESIDALKKAIE